MRNLFKFTIKNNENNYPSCLVERTEGEIKENLTTNFLDKKPLWMISSMVVEYLRGSKIITGKELVFLDNEEPSFIVEFVDKYSVEQFSVNLRYVFERRKLHVTFSKLFENVQNTNAVVSAKNELWKLPICINLDQSKAHVQSKIRQLTENRIDHKNHIICNYMYGIALYSKGQDNYYIAYDKHGRSSTGNGKTPYSCVDRVTTHYTDSQNLFLGMIGNDGIMFIHTLACYLPSIEISKVEKYHKSFTKNNTTLYGHDEYELYNYSKDNKYNSELDTIRAINTFNHYLKHACFLRVYDFKINLPVIYLCVHKPKILDERITLIDHEIDKEIMQIRLPYENLDDEFFSIYTKEVLRLEDEDPLNNLINFLTLYEYTQNQQYDLKYLLLFIQIMLFEFEHQCKEMNDIIRLIQSNKTIDETTSVWKRINENYTKIGFTKYACTIPYLWDHCHLLQNIVYDTIGIKLWCYFAEKYSSSSQMLSADDSESNQEERILDRSEYCNCSIAIQMVTLDMLARYLTKDSHGLELTWYDKIIIPLIIRYCNTWNKTYTLPEDYIQSEDILEESELFNWSKKYVSHKPGKVEFVSDDSDEWSPAISSIVSLITSHCEKDNCVMIPSKKKIHRSL